MNCPHCQQPIPPDLILRERQSELAKRKRGKHTRPGAKGLIRNPAGRPKKETKMTKQEIPSTLKRYAAKIDFANDYSGNGWWVSLKPGWIDTRYNLHFISEPTLAECGSHFSTVKPCKCERCKEARA